VPASRASSVSTALTSRRVWLLISALAAVSAALWLFVPSLAGFGGGWIAWVCIAPMFGAVEQWKLHVEVRRQVWYIALGEIPIILGLFLLSPMSGLLARLIPTAIVVGRRKVALEKKAFNLALFCLEQAVAYLIFPWLGTSDPANPRDWAAAFVAVLVVDLVGIACVYLVITISQGRLTREQMVVTFVPNLVIAPFSTTCALIVLLLVVKIDARTVFLVLGLVLVVVAGYRSYARVVRQHTTLGQIYKFTQSLERGSLDNARLEAAMERVRELFNSSSALLYIHTGPGVAPLTIWSHEAQQHEAAVPQQARDLDDPVVQRAAAISTAVRVTHKGATEAERRALRDRGASEVVVVTFRLGASAVGYLELRDRLGSVSAFTDDDLRSLENIVAHLASAIENQRLLDQLRHEAYHDRLTGLPNRQRFVMAVDEAIGVAKKSDAVAAVVLLDLDSFKDVNDALGHDYGDDLLTMVGRRMREQVGADGLVARMGADEFAMLCPAQDLGQALARAEHLRDALSRPYLLAGLTVEVGVAVGVSVAPEHAHTGGALMQRADVALSHAKATGRPVSSYLPSMEQATVHRLQLATQLRQAIGDGQVQVHYQPKLALASRDLVGVEALVRWQHPEYGAVMPDEFVPLAERTGLIGPLTRYVLKTALVHCRGWLDRDMRIGVAVNLSVKNLLDTTFPDTVFALLAEFGVPAELLTFEITESSVMSDPERSLPVLHRLHEGGIRLSIDDFGTGYSSLAYLRRLPVDEVKIDKVFVLGMGTDLGDMAIVRAIVELGRSLTLKVVAEGVEDELARDLLSGMGCDIIQGYLVSRALSPERLDAWLAARTSLGPLQAGVEGRRPQLTG
jgi:diguanylate cyclase (GGDEF)-like protein